MITGIVLATGQIEAIAQKPQAKQITLRTPFLLNDLALGDSIAVNGVCLTLVQREDFVFSADVVAETLQKTNLGLLQIGDSVNLEKMLAVTGRINGHFVQGHVDCTARIERRWTEGSADWLQVALPTQLKPYVVPKGSITIDGMSLTIVEVSDTWFTVTLIPHTLEKTIAKHYQADTVVNLEADILAKHLTKLLETHYATTLG